MVLFKKRKNRLAETSVSRQFQKDTAYTEVYDLVQNLALLENY